MTSQDVELIKLPAIFSQVQLSGLKEIVDHHHQNGHHVEFDTSEVDRIDGAAVQFLLAISKYQLMAENPTVVMKNANEVVLNAFDDMGVKDLVFPDGPTTSSELTTG